MSNPLYGSVAGSNVPYNTFPAGGERKLSTNMGKITPIYCRETLPGDVFRASTELLIKFAPLKAPVMHRLRAYVDYFFVPNFQICKVFEKFINPRINTPSSPVVMPVIAPKSIGDLDLAGLGSLADYLDLPVGQSAWLASSKSKSLSVLPFRAYQHVYNSYFRDETLQPLEDVDLETTDLYTPLDLDLEGDVLADADEEQQLRVANMLSIRYSAWKKDYFTSALTTPQAGPDVEIPFTPGSIVADGPLRFTSDDRDFNPGTTGFENMRLEIDGEDHQLGTATSGFTGVTETNAELKYYDGLSLSPDASGISVPNLRRLFAFQHFQELQGRGGSRYPEVAANYFHVRIPDLYVDRPAYLGGMYQDVSVGEVLQTSQSTTGDSGSAQGYRAGVASVYGKSKTLRYRCRMHGFIIGVLRVLPEATYMQGVERMWHRESIYDYAWPQFANIGEQEIYNRELYVDGTDKDDEVFGFAPRYAEYKDSCSHVNGDFRDSLRYWHFGRYFQNRPLLNEAFIKADQISTDPFNVTDPTVDKLYVHMYTKASCKRALPYWGTPGLYRL